MFEITALDSDRPPLHLYVYTSCERPSIYGQVKNTNNHPPRVKNLLLLSKKFRSAFVHAQAAFWLPVYYRSFFFFFFFAAPTGIQPILKRCQGFAIAFFLSVTSLCIPLKHADPRLCRTPGWHTSHTTEVQHEVRTFTKGMFLVLDAVTLSAVILHDLCAFHCDETLTCSGFRFSVGICNLPT